MSYRPRRSGARWLEGAPKALLAVYDNGGKTADRYTALYGAPLWTPDYRNEVPGRGMSSDPFHPQGVGLFGVFAAWNRSHYGRKVRFLDLPEPVRRCIQQDCRCDDCGADLVGNDHVCNTEIPAC